MADYKQSEISGTSYERAHRIVIENPLGSPATIRFYKQKILKAGDQSINLGESGSVSKTFNVGELFGLWNPMTVEPIVQVMSHEQLYALLFSLFLDTATKADDIVAKDPKRRLVGDVMVPPNYEIDDGYDSE